ncbi:response regulator [Actinoplanes sp. NPDC051859]|uniref:response regulator n=1 Tax=Actinoplanes sp. NPDC051859 TaxID=3363909 RepID=UPI0037967730
MAAILVVEDDDDLRELLTLRLSRAGHEVFSAAEGAAALRSLDECRPDVVVLDLALPVLSGFEVIREIRA